MKYRFNFNQLSVTYFSQVGQRGFLRGVDETSIQQLLSILDHVHLGSPQEEARAEERTDALKTRLRCLQVLRDNGAKLEVEDFVSMEDFRLKQEVFRTVLRDMTRGLNHVSCNCQILFICTPTHRNGPSLRT